MALIQNAWATPNADLLSACYKPDIAKATAAISAGADVNYAPQKYSPLMYAVYANNAELVTLLMKHGANPNYIGNNGATPISIAKTKKYETLTEKLTGQESKTQPTDHEPKAPPAGWYLITAPQETKVIMGQSVAERIFGQYIDKCKLVDENFVIKKNALTKKQLCGELDSKSDEITGKVTELILLCRDGRLAEVSLYRSKDRCEAALNEYLKRDADYEAQVAKEKADAKAADDRFR